MKAFVLHEPERYEVVDVPKPTIQADEVLVRVKAATICHSDLQIIHGTRESKVRYPLIPGHEFSGVVEAVGELVERLHSGDVVACEGIVWCGRCTSCRLGKTNLCHNIAELGTTKSGGFAEFVAVPAKLVHVVSGLDAESAAMTEPTANAYNAVSMAEIVLGDSVAIIGPGPIGLLALQIAKIKCPRTLIMFGTREERLSLARKLGATHTVNVRECDPVKLVMELTKGKGVQRIIQCAPTKEAFDLALAITSEDCIIVVEGVVDRNEKCSIPVNDFVGRPLRILGVRGYSRADFTLALQLITVGAIDVKSIITHRFPLERIVETFRVLELRKDGVIKVCIMSALERESKK